MKRLMVALILTTLGSIAMAQEMYTCMVDGRKVIQDRPCKGAPIKAKPADYRPAETAVSEPSPAAPIDYAKQDRERRQAYLADIERARKASEQKQKAQAAEQPPPLGEAARGELLAKRCVDKYRPHLAYPNGVRINGHRFQRYGFGETIFVDVRTITNPNTPARFDPITLNETFTCRTDRAEGIDDRYTEDHVERHKRGIRMDTR